MGYTTVIGKSLHIIGIATRITSTETAGAQIWQLWNQFYTVADQIPNRTENTKAYVLYTDYKSLAEYTTIIGVAVSSLDAIPEGFVGRTIPEQKYALFTKSGMIPQVIIDLWQEIWSTPLDRSFLIDYQYYKNSRPDGSTDLEIYVGIK